MTDGAGVVGRGDGGSVDEVGAMVGEQSDVVEPATPVAHVDPSDDARAHEISEGYAPALTYDGRVGRRAKVKIGRQVQVWMAVGWRMVHGRMAVVPSPTHHESVAIARVISAYCLGIDA